MALSFELQGAQVLGIWRPEPGTEPLSSRAFREALIQADFLDYFVQSEKMTLFWDSLQTSPDLPFEFVIAEARDAEFELLVSEDKLEAQLKVTPAYGGKPLVLSELYQLLESAKITLGILPEALQTLVQTRRPLTRVVAQGLPPEHGLDAQFKALVSEPETKGKPRELANQQVDFHDLQLLTLVEPGTLLMEKTPPTEGKPGMTIFSQIIRQNPGRDLPFGSGKGAEIDPENKYLLRATTAGQVVIHENFVSVDPILRLEEVGFHSGNIHFPGTVMVSHDIYQGFVVKADRDILVGGSVEGAFLRAEQDIVIRQGIAGNQNAVVKAGRHFQARFVDNGTVMALGSVYVSDEIIHSEVRASGEIIVGSAFAKGQIVGGRLYATQRIEARVVGSAAFTKTWLEVGPDPNLVQELAEKQKQLAHLQAQLSATGQALIYHRVNASIYPMIQALESLRFTLQTKIQDLLTHIQQLKIRQSWKTPGKILIRERIYPGVTVRLGPYTRTFHAGFSGATLYVDAQKQEIVVGSI